MPTFFVYSKLLENYKLLYCVNFTHLNFTDYVFHDLKIYKNKKACYNFIKKLEKQGYTQRNHSLNFGV